MRKPIIIAVLSLSGLISAGLRADEVKLQDDPPQQYVVVKGDTLWGISSRFLKDPWRWPDLWNMNKDKIKHPDKIHPGDLIVLDTSGESPTLRLVKGTQETIKVSPAMRGEPVPVAVIPPIPASVIEPFLAGPQIVDEAALDHSPYVVGPQDEHSIMGQGDTIYIAGIKDGSVHDWSIFRPGKALKNPDSEDVLGYEAEYVGEAKTVAPGDVTTVMISRSVQEVRTDDRLVPSSQARVEYAPHAPDFPVDGRIISAYGSVSDVGQFATVVVNKGSDDGMEIGHVLAVYRKGRTVTPEPAPPIKNAWRYLDTGCIKPGAKVNLDGFYDPKEIMQPCPKSPDVPAAERQPWPYSDIGCLKPGAKVSFDQFFDPKQVYKTHCRPAERHEIMLPDARTGLLFVYRVFEHASYALVMNTNRPVYLLDTVKNP